MHNNYNWSNIQKLKGQLIKTNPLTIKGDRTSFTAALADIYVDDTTKNIYLLDSAFNDTTSSKVKVECTKDGKVVKTEVSITNNSTVYIINEEYKMEFSFDLLRITEEVQEKLAIKNLLYIENAEQNISRSNSIIKKIKKLYQILFQLI